MSWTPERKEELARRWASGQSAALISNELDGGFSRNAIVGQVHRMGLPARTTVTRKEVIRPRRLAQQREEINWEGRRRIIADVLAKGGGSREASFLLRLSPSATRAVAAKLGVPFGTAKGRRKPRRVQKTSGAPSDRPSVKGVHQAPQKPVAFDVVPMTATTMREITDHQCHYVIGDPQGLDTVYCGGPVHARSLCFTHYHICWHRHVPTSTTKAYRVA